METEKNEKEASIVEKAEEIAKRLEEANKKAEEIFSRQSQLMAKEALSGKSTAGQIPEKPKEETPKEYKDRIMKGQL